MALNRAGVTENCDKQRPRYGCRARLAERTMARLVETPSGKRVRLTRTNLPRRFRPPTAEAAVEYQDWNPEWKSRRRSAKSGEPTEARKGDQATRATQGLPTLNPVCIM